MNNKVETDWQSEFRDFIGGLSAIIHGKCMYFDEGNGKWCSRYSHQYLSLSEMETEIFEALKEEYE